MLNDNDETFTATIRFPELIAEIEEEFADDDINVSSAGLRLKLGNSVLPFDRERVKNLKQLVDQIAQHYEEGAPVETVIDEARVIGLNSEKAENEIEKLRKKGEVYEPRMNYLRTT